MATLSSSAPQLHKSRHSYIDSHDTNATELNCVDIWTCTQNIEDSRTSKIWLVYIHGGGWRDPEVTSTAFEPAIAELWSSQARSRIAGFASIDYRLSPHPHHERLPSSDDDKSRNVDHPAHLEDIQKALMFLEEKYTISRGYVLAGHSAGATLAFQAQSSGLPKPLAILGIAGIYDIGLLLENHKTIPIYDKFIRGAFPDEETWKAASPALTEQTGFLWENSKLIVIAHSTADGLVEDAQAEVMLKKARSRKADAVHFIEAQGAHDDMWQKGDVLAELMTATLNLIEVSLR